MLPGDSEPLLGSIPNGRNACPAHLFKIIATGGDVMILTQRQELIVNPEHPNYAQLKMK